MHFTRTHLPRFSLPNFASGSWLRVAAMSLALLAAGTAQSQGDVDRIGAPADSGVRGSAALDPSAPRQLRAPTDERAQEVRARRPARSTEREIERAERLVHKPSDFEIYVNRLAFPATEFREGEPLPIRRLGSNLVDDSAPEREAVDFSPLVPPDYLISPGDEVVLSVWGSVDAELRLFVDRSGRITVPRVGSIMVSGVRYADLPETIRLRVAQTFKNFQLSVSLG
jgi:hypothetical protein